MRRSTTIALTLAILCAVALLPGQPWGAAPDYPTKPIMFNVHYAPGAAIDVAVRPLLEAVSKQLGQPLVAVNKPGGAGLVSSLATMNAKPDGYTLGSCNGASALIIPHLKDSPYHDLNGFTFICNFGQFLLPVTVPADAPYKTWKEFVDWAKKNPKRAAKVGVLGSRTQSPSAMVMWEMEQKEGIETSMIVFKGSAEAYTALLGGHIMMDAGSVSPPLIQSIKEGKLRVIAWLGKEKMPGYENVPSFFEMYNVIVPSVMGVWGPKGLPPSIVAKLENAFAIAVKDPAFMNAMNKMSMPVVFMNKAEIEKEVNDVLPKAGKILNALMAQEAKEQK